tara:strand:- start:685 stop:1488 length:804 start_codon:yes stop_codon:yes gene_type:complete
LKEYSTKKKLITNGCSFTRGHTLGEKTSWPFWLSKLTDKELYNISIGGSSNEYIALKLISYLETQTDDFIDDCFVIVQWTECVRQMVWFESELSDSWMGRQPEDGNSRWCTISTQFFKSDLDGQNLDILLSFFSSIEAALSKTYFSMLSVKKYLESKNIPYLFFDGINNHNIEIKRIDENNIKGYLQNSLLTYDELDLSKGYGSDGIRDLGMINEKTINTIYDNNFFTDYCYRYWLDVNNTKGEYVDDLHPTELASKEWAQIIGNHL